MTLGSVHHLRGRRWGHVRPAEGGSPFVGRDRLLGEAANEVHRAHGLVAQQIFRVGEHN
jgi:hypothetical protein